MPADAQRTNVLLILLIWCAGLGAAMQFAKISFSYDALELIYPGHGASFGLIVSLISLMGVLLGAVAGQLVGQLGFRRVLIWSLALGAVMSGFQALLPSYPLFLASRVLEGLSHLGIVVAGPTLIAQLAAPRHQAAALALWGSFFGVAFALTGWFGAPLVAEAGPPILYHLHGAILVTVLLFLLFLLPRQENRAETTSRPALFSGLIDSYRSPWESAAALGWFFYTLTFVSMLTLLPRIAPPGTGEMFAANLPLVSIFSGLTLAILLMRIVPAVRLYAVAFACSGLVLGYLALVGQALWPYWALGLLWGMIQSAGFASVAQLNPDAEARARANGLMAQMGNLGNLTGTPFLSAILIAGGEGGALVALALSYLLAVAVQLWLAWRRG